MRDMIKRSDIDRAESNDTNIRDRLIRAVERSRDSTDADKKPMDILIEIWNDPEMSDAELLAGLAFMGFVMGKTNHFVEYSESKEAAKVEGNMSDLKKKWGME